jgi:hypothetical protein
MPPSNRHVLQSLPQHPDPHRHLHSLSVSALEKFANSFGIYPENFLLTIVNEAQVREVC